MKIENLKDWEGRTLAPSPWLLLDQARINAFADCTCDHQFIHIDPQRAASETPFGTTIAHGFLTLSLSVHLESPDLSEIEDLGFVINYGLDKLRFINPVPAGSRVRVQSRLVEARDRGAGRAVIRLDKHMEIEGQEKPAWVAQQLFMLIPQDS
ncbi:MAG: MaoC family dehydratase [Gammaproteobacteria bacterium]|nr:MaoC family dehydratase [Gammaproteobacteria bacterium]MCY4254746.1 MaoC family dehydratase [Gammaproteobacteria bacterium]